jgi:hypothetical protein
MEAQSIGPLSNLSKLSIDEPGIFITRSKKMPKVIDCDSEDFVVKYGGDDDGCDASISVSTFTVP